jgi:hypothetical protein
MTLTIDLNTLLEDRLKREAHRRGLDPQAYARQLIEAGLSVDVEGQKRVNQSTLDLLRQWDAEQSSGDPTEDAQRERELADFKAALNQNRRDSEGPAARVPFP